MSLADGKKDADFWGKKALELMENHDIPAAPPNYEIWYNYVSEQHPDLKKTLDQMILNQIQFEGRINSDLYEKFLGNNAEKELVRHTGTQVQGQLGMLIAALGGASVQLTGYNTSIRDNLANFESGSEAGGLETFVQKMISETRVIQQANAELQAKLEKSSAEIRDLQENLVLIEKETYRDSLTGIANRKKFDSALLNALKDADETSEPLSLVVCDIDHFKKFNDSFGHPVGDQVLKLVARALHDNVKGNDLAARYGGEEFVLILPKTTLENAFTLVEKIRMIIASRTIRNRKKEIDYGNVTMSLGIALYRKGETAADLVERADNALYAAKEAGRNRTMLES